MLQGGVLVEVAPSLMRRLKQHFHRFAFGVKVIFGMSGFVWVSHISEGDMAESDELNDVSQALHGSGGDGAADKADPSQVEPEPPSREDRERVCRVRNALVVLSTAYLSVSPASVAAVYHASLAAGLAAKDMLTPHAAPQLIESTVRMAEEQAAAAAEQTAEEAEDAAEDASTMVDAAGAAPRHGQNGPQSGRPPWQCPSS